MTAGFSIYLKFACDHLLQKNDEEREVRSELSTVAD